MDRRARWICLAPYLWGPRGYTGESVIVMHGRQEDLEKRFEVVRKVTRVEHPYSMPLPRIEVAAE